MLDSWFSEACEGILTSLNIGEDTECECGGELSFSPLGMTGTADCSSTACLDETEEVCGVAEFDIDFGLGAESIESNITTCFTVTSGFLEDLSPLLGNKVCVIAETEGLTLSQCTATVGDWECGCSICESSLAFTIDCSEVNISPVKVIFIPGPVFECLGLDFAPEES